MPVPDSYDFSEKEVADQKAWDDAFKKDENWTGASEAKVSTESRRDIKRTMELNGDIVATLSKDEAKDIADFYSARVKALEKAFSERLKGPKAMEMLRAYFMGPIFGFNIYAEGTSGVGKTWTMNRLSEALDFPFSTLHARSDTSDAELIGEERLVRNATGENNVAFAHGVVTKPGVCGVLMDEFPRLPARSSNSCLQAMEDRWVRVPLNSLQRPDHKTTLSWSFCFIACGNPASYVGQGERNRALFDRFAIGIEVVRPDDADSLLMYDAKDESVKLRDELKMFGSNTFRRLRGSLRFVQFIRHDTQNPHRDQFKQLLAASAAVSPAGYLRSTGWVGGAHEQETSRSKDVWTPTLDELNKHFRSDAALKAKCAAISELREQVNENVLEGSNPRGELQVLEVARALRLLDDSDNGKKDGRFYVTNQHMKQAFIMANLVRLKPYPGCEESIRTVVEKAADIFFI